MHFVELFLRYNQYLYMSTITLNLRREAIIKRVVDAAQPQLAFNGKSDEFIKSK